MSSYFDLCCVPGFAVSLQVILSSPKAVFKRRGSQPGMQESDFLKQITKVEELEPKADNCTKVKPPNVTSEFYFFIDTLFIIVYALLHSVHSSKVDIVTIHKVQNQVFFFLWEKFYNFWAPLTLVITSQASREASVLTMHLYCWLIQ